MAALGTDVLLAEIEAGIEAFRLLEPEVQKVFVALFHLFHRKQTPEAQPANNPPPEKAVPPSIDLLSSTSLDPENPNIPKT